MNGRSLCRVSLILTTAVVLLLGLSACNLFGNQSAPAPTATNPPPPTETPLPQLPTFTPSPTAPPPTPTATPTEGEAAAAAPTLTPTTEAQEPEAPPEVGGDGPTAPEPSGAEPVRYVVTRIPASGNVITNGGFEQGFQDNGLGNNWAGFNNGGVGTYSYADEMLEENVSHDNHAQRLQISGAGNVDRYIGMYQTADVVAGETYTLTLHGLIRSSTAEDPKVPYGHRMQYAIDYQGNTDWRQVQEWVDPGWNEVSMGADYPAINSYVLPFTAQSDKLTLFVRGWTKWPIQSLAQFYVDGISLEGPIPGGGQEVVTVAQSGGGNGDATAMPTTGGSAIWLPLGGLAFVIGFALWEIRRTRARAAE